METQSLPQGTFLKGNEYVIDEMLGQGGFGITYKATKVSLSKPVAIKEYFPDGVCKRSDDGKTVVVPVESNHDVFVRQKSKFIAEAGRLAQFHNAHIVPVHDLFEENGTAYYEMDYIEGESLEELLKRTEEPLKETKVRSVLDQMLEALDHIHSQKPPLCHLDIKPANIMMEKNGKVMLVDFGASKYSDVADQSRLSSSSVVYSVGYAPLEQLSGTRKEMGPWTDFYALGATLFNLLTCRQPPEPSDLLSDPTPLKENSILLPAETSRYMRELICWMMSVLKDERPKSVIEIRNFLVKESPPADDILLINENPLPIDEEVQLVVVDLVIVNEEDPSNEEDLSNEEDFSNEEDPFDDESPSEGDVRSFTDGNNPANEVDQSEVEEGTTGNKEGTHHGRTLNGLSKVNQHKWWLAGGIVAIVLLFLLIRGNLPSYFSGTSTFDEVSDSIADSTSVNDLNEEGTLSSQSELASVVDNIIKNMVFIEGGIFTMGATSEQGNDAYSSETPTHKVKLSSFSIGRYEVTQEEWEAVMGNNPSKFIGPKRPVERVSWDDCQKFIEKLNEMSGKKFRLPTEAEWEYAARGGKKGVRHKYMASDDINAVGWYKENSYEKGANSPDYGTHPIGEKKENELGLYDMSGNVWEWCNDFYDEYHSSEMLYNPKGATSGSTHVIRGGSWYSPARLCRVSFRYNYEPSYQHSDLGLRLAQ